MKALLFSIVAVLIAGGTGAYVLTHQSAGQIGDGVSYGSAGPDINSPYLQWGGVAQYHYRVAMHSATTTLCAIQNQTGATSTVSFQYQVTIGTSTASTITVATSSSQFATTTTNALQTASPVASNAVATFSSGITANNNLVAPNQWVLFKTEGPGLGGYTYTGLCQATFVAIR